MADPDKTPGGKRKCVGCGTELPGGASPDLCPKCLLKLAMETQPGPGPGGTLAASGAGGKSRGLPQAGEQLGHYAIVRLLGAGGMGAVYEAQDLESGRRVALKVLSHTLDSPEARERFFREGRLAASINHPNSVYIFGTEEIGGTPVITMELVSGGTLQDRVRARGPLPVGEAVDAVLQMVEGLEAAQRLGILHRDIKPSNCYVGEDGTVKIGDFGLSISTALRTEPALTATGAFLGTPAFCSPEQLRGEELNARSDMYSVGVTLYYLLTGRTPFTAQNTVQLLATVLEQRPPSPRQFRPEVPKGLAKAVLRCLEKQAGERFKSYADLARALAPYSSAAPTPATLGLRFLAGVVDMTLLSLLAAVVNISVCGGITSFMDEAMKLSPRALACLIGWFCMATLYFGLLEGLWGAAVGKALCRLRVVGPDRNPPGFGRAWLRAVLFLVPPLAPYWIAFGANPKAYMSMSQWTQMGIGLTIYVVMALLFVTARRRNGFAAVQDLLTRTRVVSRAAVRTRPALGASEAPPPAIESAVTIGPYHVLQALTDGRARHSVRAGEVEKQSEVGSGGTVGAHGVTRPTDGGEEWFLAYDLKLLRKVWLREAPPGAEPVPAPLRSLGRVGRLRWLTGKRSPEENWDAFEALSGQPLLALMGKPQPWSEVRYWLHDLATEISAAEKDGTLPQLTLDRVWITAEGRAKLLDCRAPGLVIAFGRGTDGSPLTPSLFPSEGERVPVGAGEGNLATAAPPVSQPPPLIPGNAFLNAVVAAAFSGSPDGTARAASEVAAPLPLHARGFLKGLPQLAGADAVAASLKPLLSRVAEVSRLRRAALVAGCMVFPLLACAFMPIMMAYMQDVTRKNPGMMDLSSLLQVRGSARFWAGKHAQLPADRQMEIYIAHHYHGLITNAASWSSPFVLSIIKGEARKFAEQSLADYPAPTEAEIAEADAAVGKYVPKGQMWPEKAPPGLTAVVLAGCLFIYVSIPALVAALLFRGGVVLLIAGVTYVRRDGARASRLRLFWRALLTWAPAFLLFGITIFWMAVKLTWQPWLAVALFGLLAAVSLALPVRGLQDRLAGTWPVPR